MKKQTFFVVRNFLKTLIFYKILKFEKVGKKLYNFASKIRIEMFQN